MKVEFKKKLPFTIVTIIVAIFTITFALLSISSTNAYIFSMFLGGVCLTMLLNGFNCYVYQKQRIAGFFLWFVSAFVLFVMIYTIIS